MEKAENSILAFAQNNQLHSKNGEQFESLESYNYDAENEHLGEEGESQVADLHRRLHELIAEDSRNFDSWSTLIEEVEGICPDNLDIISLSYDSFLSRFPLCHWYWRKYTDHIIRLSDAHKAVKVFERAVGSTTLSVGLWVEYCRFGVSFYEDPFDVRRLFKRALMFVQKDYLCHALWNEYIKFELTQQHWGFLANIYLQVLKFPTEFLHKYYENFKQFVAGMEEELKKHNDCRIKAEAGVLPNVEIKCSEHEISQVIEDLQNPANEAVIAKAVHTYKSIGEQFYQKANDINEKIKSFETNIQRRYFDTSPLDDEELKNWHQYLDFIEMQEDFDWALQVYERCLIPCAYYPEFWMRYVEFMESQGGREFANSGLERATLVFLKDVPEIHLFNARFKEQIGDANAACAALVQCDMGSNSYFPKHIIELANIERRLGKWEAASDRLEKAINLAEKMEKLHDYSSLFIQSCRFKYMATGSADAARDVLIDGIQRIPHCFQLLEELIKFAMMHEGSKQVNLLESIIAHAISPSSDGSQCLALKDRQRLSLLFLEFVDLFGTINDVRRARIRHVQLFPQLIRNNFVDKPLGSGNCLSNEILKQRESGPCAFCYLQIEGQNSKHPIQEQVKVVPVNCDSEVELICADQTPQISVDNMECEREQQLSSPATNEATFPASKVNELTHALVVQPVDGTPGVVEPTLSSPQQPKGVAPGPMETIPTSVHVSSEDKQGGKDSSCTFDDQSTAIAIVESQKHSVSFDKQDPVPKQHPVPVSFDNLSLHSKGKSSTNLIAEASVEPDTMLVSKSSTSRPQDCLNSNTIPPTASPNSTAAADSVEVQEFSDDTESASMLSSASQQKSTAMNTDPNSLVTPSMSADQMHRGTIPECKTSGMHLQSKLQHQHQQPSTLHDNPTVTMGSPIPISQGYPQHTLVTEQVGHAQENIATNHFRPANNVHNVSSSSTNQSHMSSPLISCPQPNLLVHGSQGNQQPMSTHYSQTLNQGWQSQQNLLQQQYQQQLVQMLPQQQHQQFYPHAQPQHNQQQVYSWQQQPQQHPSVPYQVQQLQQQQQAQQQLQQQHYHQFPPQFQLHQGQQQQLLQLREQQIQQYRQSEKLAYEMHQPAYQRHAAQAYQTTLQQYQLHQQVHGPMSQQHQQHQYQYNLMQQQLHQSPPHQKQHGGQQQQHQPKASNQDLAQGICQLLQDRQNVPEDSNSAQVQHLSPQSMARPITEIQSQTAVSLHNQQPPHDTSPSSDINTPESAASSSHGQ